MRMAKNSISRPEKYEELENNASYTAECSVAEECVGMVCLWGCRWTGGYKQKGVCDAQGSLMCYSPRGHKELDTTEQLNGTELKQKS